MKNPFLQDAPSSRPLRTRDFGSRNFGQQRGTRRPGFQPNRVRSGLEQFALLRWLRTGLAVLGLLLVMALLFPPRWYAELLAGPWHDPKGSVLIVLASDSTSPNLLGEFSYWRAVYAVQAWREGGFQKIVISGNSSSAMRDYMISAGVPAGSMIAETRSTSTHENAEFAVPLVRGLAGPMVLLTSDYHMFRAHRAFTKAGLTVLPRPVPDAGKRLNNWRWRWTVAVELVEETVKILNYLVKGWI